MRKNMFDRLLENGLQKERLNLAASVSERLEGYTIPETVRTLPLTCDGNPHPIDVYMPNDESKHPALINIHGGGLVLGSNAQNKQYCVHMAERGYIVFAIDYTTVPEVTALDQLEQIASSMDAIRYWLNAINKWDGCTFGVGDSAGTFLLMYSCVLANNPEIAEAFGIKGTNLKFDAVAFQNGMFYSTRRDKIGMLASKFFGAKYGNKPFAKYLNPELPEIVMALPPFFMMTTINDYLRHYSVDFARAAKKIRNDFVFMDYFKLEALGHADAATRPFHEESIIVNDDIDEFFHEFMNK